MNDRPRTVDDLAEVVRFSLINLQVCVPETWDNEQAEEFANREHPTGISSQWQVTQVEDNPERVPCEERECFVHIVLEC